jgi:LysM repeat protein
LLQPEAKSVSLRSHRIERGDSLSGIAWRYGTSVKALAAANGLTDKQIIRTGQKLVIPQHSRPGGGDDWIKYATPAKQRGRLELHTFKSRFRGSVVEGGKLLPSAREAISKLLGAKGSHPQLSERLLRLLVRVSDTFGGRPLRVVSGYRSSSYFSDSRHKTSEAVDFSIPGIPNDVLRQYLLLLDEVGVGYYPNSSFIHLDVRDCSMQWVDYAGPGEAPRRSPRQPALPVMASKTRAAGKAGKAAKASGELPRAEDLDDIAEEVAAAMEEAGRPVAAPDAHKSSTTVAAAPDPLASSDR